MDINPGTNLGRAPQPAAPPPAPPAFEPAAAEPPPVKRQYADLPPDMPQFTSGDPYADEPEGGPPSMSGTGRHGGPNDPGGRGPRGA